MAGEEDHITVTEALILDHRQLKTMKNQAGVHSKGELSWSW